MILNDFYKYSLAECNHKEINAIIKINKSHRIFKGHFPGQPIVPGVTEILMIKEILNAYLNLDLQLASAASIKFLTMINPNENDRIQVNILYKKEGNCFKVNAKLYCEKVNYLKLKGSYSEKG